MDPSLEDKKFETICQSANEESSNLNARFEAYGVNTLEAKVPVVSDVVVEQLKGADDDDRMIATLALKAKSASSALEGRPSRTRNKVLTMVPMGQDVILATGATRERSPVDQDQLDEDLEQYMRVAAEKKRLATGQGPLATTDPEPTTSNGYVHSSTKHIFKPLAHSQPKQDKMDCSEDIGTQEDLDKDLEDYMAKAKSLKAQKQRIAHATDRAAMMEEMENWDL